MRRNKRNSASWLLLLLIAVTLFAAYDWLLKHPQHNPLEPLRLSHASGWATQKKLAAFADNPKICFAALDQAGVEHKRLPDIGIGSCLAEQRTQIAGWASAPAPVQPAGVAPSCAVGAALLLWQRDVVQPMAQVHLGRKVRLIEHLGSYNCRSIRGSAQPSEHSTGNAIDISAFLLSDGSRVSLVDHWDAPDGRSAFLKAIRGGACGYFTTVLSPDYNDAHADHFHLDQAKRTGGWAACR